MACSITLTAQSLDCSPNIGGVKAVWLANRDDVVLSSISTIAATLSAAAGKTNPVFKKIGVRSGISSFTSTAQVSEENNTLYYRDEVAVVINKMTQNALDLISRVPSGDMLCVVEDMNGEKWLIGYGGRILVAGSVLETGTAKTDRNGETLTLACDHPGTIKRVNPATSASIFSN